MSPALLDILISAKETTGERLKLIAATYACPPKTDLRTRQVKEFPINPLFQDQIENLLCEYWGQKSPFSAQRVLKRFEGNPLLTDAFLQFPIQVSQHSLDELPEYLSEQYETISAMLYSQLEAESKLIIGALSILHDRGTPRSLATIIGMNPEQIIKISQTSPLISSFPNSEVQLDTRLDLYHPMFGKHVRSLVPAESKARLNQKIGSFYLQLIESHSSQISPGAAISVPRFFRDYDKHLYADAVVRTLPLALLVGDTRTTKNYVNEALKVCQKNGMTEEATLLNSMSILRLEEGDLNGAARFSQEALAVVRQKPKRRFLENTILSNLAHLLQLQGKLTEALRYALEALSVSQQLYLEYNFQGSLAASLSNIGLLHSKLGDLENSLKYYESALQVDKRTNNASGIASDLRRIGGVLEDMEQFDRAIEMHLQALEIDRNLNDLNGVASDYGNLGATYHLKGDHTRSVSWLERSLELFTKIGARDEAAQVQGLLNEIVSNAKSS